MTESDRSDANLSAIVLRSTGAATISSTEVVQSLWSGYGQIVRCHLTGSATRSVVLKHVCWPDEQAHPYGWTSDRSHQRKLKSYRVETAWYGQYAERCLDACRVPNCLAVEHRPDGVLLLLEDLDAAGFAGRRRSATRRSKGACPGWQTSTRLSWESSPKGCGPSERIGTSPLAPMSSTRSMKVH